MLRPEHRDQVDVVTLGHHVDAVPQVRQHTGRVRDHADALVAKITEAVPDQEFQAGTHSALVSAGRCSEPERSGQGAGADQGSASGHRHDHEANDAR
ncbi:hypothetical protein [Microlunatus parietis]|uniref:Uncharacterized protein n=1 Tax=Microlunatus parietis TaxID=682979 RepID=A0A7Y9I969_9ACTN|nr:hypothetical protein [Microlunatus parietis]NYE72522.1 hypothetical protein [Microlunatus parietis]